MGLTVEQIVHANDRAYREAWVKEAAVLKDACKKLRKVLVSVEKVAEVGIPEVGGSEVYVGAGLFLESDCRKVLEQYRRLEEIKRGAVVFEALIKAIEEGNG